MYYRHYSCRCNRGSPRRSQPGYSETKGTQLYRFIFNAHPAPSCSKNDQHFQRTKILGGGEFPPLPLLECFYVHVFIQ